MRMIAGADGCNSGWIVALAPARLPLKGVSIVLAARFQDVLRLPADVLCVDIPIGLNYPRECDLEAQKYLGKRWACVFSTPPRVLVREFRPTGKPSYPSAKQLAISATGKSISKQCYSICPKISEVDRALTPKLQSRVREVHPEVSFAALRGTAIPEPKRTSGGATARKRILTHWIVDLNKVISFKLPGVERDDILDSLVCAITAAAVSAGEYCTLPSHPPKDSKGLRMEMVLPSMGK